jgi:Concanavalin A-like lectin/glucanases superfamily
VGAPSQGVAARIATRKGADLPITSSAAVAPYAAVLAGNAYLEAPPIGVYQLGRGDFTIEAWIRTASAGGSGTVIARKGSPGGPNDGGFLLVVRPDGTIKLATDNGFAYFEGITVATAVNDARWHHVAAVRHGASIQVYLDGLPNASATCCAATTARCARSPARAAGCSPPTTTTLSGSSSTP